MSKDLRCQKCGQNPATTTVTETGETFYTGVAEGKRAQRLLFVCETCAQASPPNARL